LKATTTSGVKNLENEVQGDRARIKRLETSHSGLKEDKKALYKRVTTLKETLEHKVKVEVGEGILRPAPTAWQGLLEG
jgi:predicted nuclease with TOPRIM domain